VMLFFFILVKDEKETKAKEDVKMLVKAILKKNGVYVTAECIWDQRIFARLSAVA